VCHGRLDAPVAKLALEDPTMKPTPIDVSVSMTLHPYGRSSSKTSIMKWLIGISLWLAAGCGEKLAPAPAATASSGAVAANGTGSAKAVAASATAVDPPKLAVGVEIVAYSKEGFALSKIVAINGSELTVGGTFVDASKIAYPGVEASTVKAGDILLCKYAETDWQWDPCTVVTGDGSKVRVRKLKEPGKDKPAEVSLEASHLARPLPLLVPDLQARIDAAAKP
jgi:hypothetical protein